MEDLETRREKFERHSEFLEKLLQNKLEIPNEFTIELGKAIKKAREEDGINQSQLAEKLSRSQATVSDIENGKVDISVLTLVSFARALNKPISYFIPEMTFLTSLHDIHNKDEEELLTIFREMENVPYGDPKLVLRFIKMLFAYDEEVFERQEKGYPDGEEEEEK